MAKRVLLAEDEPNIVESLRFLLGRAGFTVEACDNGRIVLERALTETPDVIVLDVMLPEMDGFEILRRLRAERQGIDLPVLMLTAKGQREDRERAIRAGADMFITKPFANSDLVAAVEQLAAGGSGLRGAAE